MRNKKYILYVYSYSCEKKKNKFHHIALRIDAIHVIDFCKLKRRGLYPQSFLHSCSFLWVVSAGTIVASFVFVLFFFFVFLPVLFSLHFFILRIFFSYWLMYSFFPRFFALTFYWDNLRKFHSRSLGTRRAFTALCHSIFIRIFHLAYNNILRASLQVALSIYIHDAIQSQYIYLTWWLIFFIYKSTLFAIISFE